MDCKQINEFLMDYLYQELDPAQAERFEAHLQHCPGCTELLGGFERTRSAFADLPEEDPPAAVSALLLREAARAAAPPQPGFWEQLRAGLRAMVMHPAMTVATTMVLVLGVSFYIYKQGPAPGSREMVDVPLVDEPHALDHDRTAAIGVSEREKSAPAAAPPMPEPARLAQQAPASGDALATGAAVEKKGAFDPALKAQAEPAFEGGYKELATLDGKDGVQAGGAGRRSRGAAVARQVKAADREGDADDLDELMDNAVDMPRRDTAKATPSARPASEPPPSPPRPSAQLAKRNEKVSAKGWGDPATGAPADESVMGGTEQAAAAPRATVPVVVAAKPKAKPAARRPARSRNRAPSGMDKNKDDDNIGSLEFWKSGGKKLVGSSASGPAPAKTPAPPQEAEEERQNETKAESAPVAKQQARKQAPLASTRTQEQPATPPAGAVAMTLAEQGHLSADSGLCAKALEYYNKAVNLQPSLRSDRDLVARVHRCAGKLAESGGETSVAKAQKRYPRLASLLEQELQRQRSMRASRKRAAESQKKASKRSKAKKKAAPKTTSAY